MTVTVQPLRPAEWPAFIARSNAEYRRERIEAGDSPEYAEKRAAQSNEQFFPDGRPAEGQQVLRVLEDGHPVGSLWLGPFDPEHPRDWWVFDIEIDPENRGRGLGRAAMLQAEEVARAHGAVKLGLNVFGPNTVAQGLYRSLGYETTAINLAKAL